MEILVHHQLRILNTISRAMKYHVESPDNTPVVVVSGFINNSAEIINKEDEITELEFESVIFNDTEDIEICIENFKSNSIKDIVSVNIIKNKEISGDNRFPLKRLNAKINIAGLEFEV